MRHWVESALRLGKRFECVYWGFEGEFVGAKSLVPSLRR
jgi:hypothetical protein